MTADAQTAPTKQPTSTRTIIMRVLSIVVTLGLMVYLLQQVEWEDFTEILARMSLISIGAAFLTYTLLNFFRALRFRALLDRPETSLSALFPITLYHNFLVRVLPFKLGELSYIVLLRSRLNYSIQEGVSSLFGARLLELLIIIMVLATGVVTSGDRFAEDSGVLLLLGGLFIASLVALYFAGPLTRFGTRILSRLLDMVLKNRPALLDTLLDKINAIAEEFDSLREPRLFMAALFFTIFTYGSAFAGNFILMQAAGVDVDFSTMIMIISIGMFASAFPFSVSGFGVVEFSWAFGLTNLAGLTTAEAAAIGIMLHGYQVISASILGLIGYIIIRVQGTVPSPAEESPHPVQTSGMESP